MECAMYGMEKIDDGLEMESEMMKRDICQTMNTNTKIQSRGHWTIGRERLWKMKKIQYGSLRTKQNPRYFERGKMR